MNKKPKKNHQMGAGGPKKGHRVGPSPKKMDGTQTSSRVKTRERGERRMFFLLLLATGEGRPISSVVVSYVTN